MLVSTPEAFRIKMASGAENASVDDFGFVVFDEVHHVMKRHPHRKIARLLEMAKNPKPTVLALTATCTYAVNEVQVPYFLLFPSFLLPAPSPILSNIFIFHFSFFISFCRLDLISPSCVKH